MGTAPKRILAIVLGVIAVIIVLAVSFGKNKEDATTPVTKQITTTAAVPQPAAPTTPAPQPVIPETTTAVVPVQPVVPAVPEPSTDTPVPTTYYKSCAEAKAAGAAPLHRGDPGYRPGLDRDGDGVACER